MKEGVALLTLQISVFSLLCDDDSPSLLLTLAPSSSVFFRFKELKTTLFISNATQLLCIQTYVGFPRIPPEILHVGGIHNYIS